MSEITRSMIRSALGELKISVGIYKNKLDGKLGAMIDSINNHHFVFNGSVWEKQEKIFKEVIEMKEEQIIVYATFNDYFIEMTKRALEKDIKKMR